MEKFIFLEDDIILVGTIYGNTISPITLGVSKAQVRHRLKEIIIWQWFLMQRCMFLVEEQGRELINIISMTYGNMIFLMISGFKKAMPHLL